MLVCICTGNNLQSSNAIWRNFDLHRTLFSVQLRATCTHTHTCLSLCSHSITTCMASSDLNVKGEKSNLHPWYRKWCSRLSFRQWTADIVVYYIKRKLEYAHRCRQATLTKCHFVDNLCTLKEKMHGSWSQFTHIMWSVTTLNMYANMKRFMWKMLHIKKSSSTLCHITPNSKSFFLLKRTRPCATIKKPGRHCISVDVIRCDVLLPLYALSRHSTIHALHDDRFALAHNQSNCYSPVTSTAFYDNYLIIIFSLLFQPKLNWMHYRIANFVVDIDEKANQIK